LNCGKNYQGRKELERRDTGINYWDNRAEDFSESRKTNDYEYGRKVIKATYEILKPEFEVLDVGAGPGTFVIPFAKKVNNVTALEPSQKMREMIIKNAAEEGIDNIKL
jgi:tRNA/tmRNA/rRNA uracil-C5-methylase (TrmA/RlmC/RlmD family)